MFKILKARFSTFIPRNGTFTLEKCIRSPRNQRRQHRCAAYASASLLEYHYRQVVNEYFSPHFIYMLRPRKQLKGMMPCEAMDILKRYGCCELSMARRNQISVTDEMLKHAQSFKIDDYFGVQGIDETKNALMRHGPLLFVLPYYNTGNNFWIARSANQAITGLHTVLIVGFDSNGIRIRNSWGDSWNDNGHAHVDWQLAVYHQRKWGCFGAHVHESRITATKESLERESKRQEKERKEALRVYKIWKYSHCSFVEK